MPNNVTLIDVKTGKAVQVAPEDVRPGLASKKYVQPATVPIQQRDAKDVSLSPGSKALDRLDLGTDVSVDNTDTALADAESLREKLLSTPDQVVQTAGEGILSGLTLGVYEGEQGYEGDARREINSGAYSAGELAAIVATAGIPLTPAGAVGKLSASAGRAVTKLVGEGKLASIAGTAVEGAIFGAAEDTVSQLSDVVIRDKAYVGERLATAISLGAMMGVGSEAVLQGAKRVIAAHVPKVAATKAAVLPAVEVEGLHTAISETRKVMDDALETFSQRQTVLASFQEDVALGRSIASTADAPWFRGATEWFRINDELLEKAYGLRSTLSEFKENAILASHKKVARSYAKALEEYERVLNQLQERLGRPPEGLLGKAGGSSAPSTQAVTAAGGKKAIEPQAATAARGKAPVENKLGTLQVKGGRKLGPGSIPNVLPGGPEAIAKLPGGKLLKAAEPPTALPEATLPTRNPLLAKYVDDWFKTGATDELISATTDVSSSRLGKSVSGLRLKLDEKIGTLNVPGGVKDIRAVYKLKDEFGPLGTAVLDAWSYKNFADDTAREAAGIATKLRGKVAGQAPEKKAGVLSRLVAPVGRYAVRRQLGYGYMGMAAGQAAYGAMVGAAKGLGKLVSWADEIHLKAANAVDALLTGRTGKITRALTAAKLSYTGDDKDATTSLPARAAQLNRLSMSPQGALTRVEEKLQPIVKYDPELAAAAMDATKLRLLNLARKAPLFVTDPSKVPDRPFGREWDAFQQYEAVTHDVEVAISAVSSGTLTAAMGEALREQHPKLAERIIEKVLRDLTPDKLSKMTPKQSEQLGYLLGSPILPTNFANTQDMYDAVREAGNVVPGGNVNWRGMPRQTTAQQFQSPVIRPQ